MATINVCELHTSFIPAKHSATSYRFYDGDTDEVIDENLHDTSNLLKWSSPLLDGVGGYRTNISNLRGKIKFHFGLYDESEWFEVMPTGYDQTAEHPPIYGCGIDDIIIVNE